MDGKKFLDHSKVKTLDASSMVMVDGDSGTKLIAATDFIGAALDATPDADLPVVTSVNGATGDVVIGGRNYALDTAKILNLKKTSSAAAIAYINTSKDIKLHDDKHVTVLFRCQRISGAAPLEISIRQEAEAKIITNVVNYRPKNENSAEWGIATLSFIEGCSLKDVHRISFAVRESVGEWEVDNVKLELGNVATDWTPAPEDLAPADLFDNPVMHRNIYRGKYLGDHVTDEQAAAIYDGSFKDLYVGDYWTKDGIDYRLADMMFYYNVGDVAFKQNHAVIVPDQALAQASMNDENSTAGGYAGSKMRTETLPNVVLPKIKAMFGDLVLTHKDYFTNAVTDGHPSAGAWVDSTVDLMNEIMVYGTHVYAPASNGVVLLNKYTTGKQQLALFALNPKMVNTRQTYWLRDVVSASSFALEDALGRAADSGASSSNGVRPYFIIGGRPAASTLESHERMVDMPEGVVLSDDADTTTEATPMPLPAAERAEVAVEPQTTEQSDDTAAEVQDATAAVETLPAKKRTRKVVTETETAETEASEVDA